MRGSPTHLPPGCLPVGSHLLPWVCVREVSVSVTPRWQVVAASGSLQLWPTIKQAFTGFKGIIDGITQGELSGAPPTPTPTPHAPLLPPSKCP